MGFFSQLEARELLERYIRRRMKLAKWYKNVDPCDPKILAAFDLGSVLILPERDNEGRKIFIAKPSLAEFSGKPFSKNDFFRAFACLYDYMCLMDERTCVNGTVILIDVSRYSLKIHAEMSMEERKDLADAWKDSFPGRLKLVLLFNAGTMVEILYTILNFCLSEELQKMIKNHGDVLENVYKDIPMRCLPVEYLPTNYKGPNAGTERQIIESMKRDLTRPEVRARLQYLSSELWKIDEAQKPCNNSSQESFRKVILE